MHAGFLFKSGRSLESGAPNLLLHTGEFSTSSVYFVAFCSVLPPPPNLKNKFPPLPLVCFCFLQDLLSCSPADRAYVALTVG